ncbi:MAG: transcriptional regulator [Actinobacteria bacterium]|nr:transcriptional regulator [Actinomycetota bacterium]
MADVPAVAGIDRLIHEPGRLAILAVLNAVDEADFLFLLRQTGLTRGNLSSHTAKLENGGYIAVEKSFVDKVPHTVYRLTDEGRTALDAYRRQMTGILEAME